MLTSSDLIIHIYCFVGAHTVGVSHCTSFKYRLYKSNTSKAMDPPLNEELIEKLSGACPLSNHNGNEPNYDPLVRLDTFTLGIFDNVNYASVEFGQRLLESNFGLCVTSLMIRSNAEAEFNWINKFKEAMVKMSVIEVKIGSGGEIRHNCHFIMLTISFFSQKKYSSLVEILHT